MNKYMWWLVLTPVVIILFAFAVVAIDATMDVLKKSRDKRRWSDLSNDAFNSVLDKIIHEDPKGSSFKEEQKKGEDSNE